VKRKPDNVIDLDAERCRRLLASGYVPSDRYGPIDLVLDPDDLTYADDCHPLRRPMARLLEQTR
jgi:hypothetical protein